jgi:hypothetical protein
MMVRFASAVVFAAVLAGAAFAQTTADLVNDEKPLATYSSTGWAIRASDTAR